MEISQNKVRIFFYRMFNFHLSFHTKLQLKIGRIYDFGKLLEKCCIIRYCVDWTWHWHWEQNMIIMLSAKTSGNRVEFHVLVQSIYPSIHIKDTDCIENINKILKRVEFVKLHDIRQSIDRNDFGENPSFRN